MAHPGIETIVELLGGIDLHTTDITARRAALESTAGAVPPPEGVGVTPATVAGRPAEWLDPPGADPATRTHAVLYLHGGAYTVGSLNTHRALGGRLAIATGVAVVTLDYRLAPEHPFPAAVEDAASALAELVGRFGADHVAIAGDSAGGGLAIATVLLARGRGQALPAAVATISPWADLTHTHETHTTKADVDPWVATEVLDVSAADYLAGAEATDPLASPVFADLAGLPPLRIDVGDREVLLGDSLVLAERARAAGVAVDLHEWPEMIHVFPAFPGELVPEADAAVAAIGAFLRGHLA